MMSPVKKDNSVVIDSKTLKVLSVHVENDGTALKPALQFDPTQKCVVGLANGNHKMDFVYQHQDKSQELTSYLKENIATEASVTLLTISPKTSALSVEVSYHSQKGKTGENLKNKLIQEVVKIQCYRVCLEFCSSNVTVQSDCCMSSVCNRCTELQSVCDKCKDAGQVSHYPSLRPCHSCLEKNIQCVRLIALTWNVDCESGN